MTCAVRHPSFRLASPTLIGPLALGLAVRLLFLAASGEIRPSYDEKTYVKFGAILDTQGSYDGYWPPGYPAVIAAALRLFAANSVLAVQLLQIVGSVVIGHGVIQMAHRLFGIRSALLSGYAWAVYLPLAFYTHRLWPETLFLVLFVPAMYLILCFTLAEVTEGWWWKLAIAGGLFALALAFKEGPVLLLVPLTLLLLYRDPRRRLRGAIAFLAATAVVLCPLTIRNVKHYQRFVLVAASLGTNVQRGMNKFYVNHDYNRSPDIVRRVHCDAAGNWDFCARHFIQYGEGWSFSQARNPIDRARADFRTALGYAAQHPRAFVLTRIKKAADFLTPLSFLIRDLSPDVYSGVVASAGCRQVLVPLSLSMAMALLSLAWINLVRCRDRRPVLWFFAALIGYFLASAMLVSMSRFRVPIEPFLLVLAGATGVRWHSANRRRTTVIAGGVGLLALLLLWLLNLGEIVAVITQSLG